MARPRLQVDEEQLVLLASLGLTQEECAAVLKCSPDTIQRNFFEAWDEGRRTCMASLRRRQYELAAKGNVTMLIWLGKNLLGQSDKLEATGRDGAPLFPPVDREELIGKLTGPRKAEPDAEPLGPRDASGNPIVQ